MYEKKGGHMKKFIKKSWQYAFIFIWFVASIFFFEYMLNRSNTDLTEEMSAASLPVICVRSSGHDYNRMYGYTREMDFSLIRDGITPLEEGRKLDLRIYKKNENIKSLRYELHSIDGQRFVEEGDISDYVDTSEYIDLSMTFKDIIADKTDYSLKIVLTLNDDREVYYYSRVFKDDDVNLFDKLEYVYYFNECTFDKQLAIDELSKYMESNSSGDNSDFSHVDIHSSMDQLTWGDLKVERLKEPVCTVCEIDSKNAVMKLEYMINAYAGEEKRMYYVSEYYNFVKGSERMYLLSFDRYMDTVLFIDEGVVYKDKLMIGITGEDLEYSESEDGNTYAFVNRGSLYIVNSQQNTCGTAYSFYDKDNLDERCLNDSHNIKIVNIDETGNVLFYVYGYFNRGEYEGRCGINLFEYNCRTNAVVEKIFVESDVPYEVMKNDIEKMTYANYQNEMYFYLDETVFKVNTETKEAEKVTQDLDSKNFFASKDSSMCAWVSKESDKGAEQITFLRNDTSESYTIEALSGESLNIIGFMGEDLIFARVKKSDIYQNESGENVYPMYEINIINKFNIILKKYSEDNIYVMACKINDNLITLTRNEKNSDGMLVSAPPDSIVNTLIKKTEKNTAESIITQNLKRIVQVTLKKEMDEKKIKYKTPKTEIQEGKREIIVDCEGEGLYYVFAKTGCQGSFSDEKDAVIKAFEMDGCVIDHNGHYIWKKETYRSKNQIMKISDTNINENDEDSLEKSIEIMLEYEGYSLDIKNRLNSGESAQDILEDNIPDSKGVYLANVSPETIKYYLNKDIPVIAVSDQNCVLIVGYSDSNYVWLNPQTGNLMKTSIDEANNFYELNGFRFITYVKWEM